MFMVFYFFLMLFFGFFDLFYLIFLSLFFCFFLVFSFTSFYFRGVFFCDSLSFFLLFLTFWVFIFCFFSNLMDKWVSNRFFGYSFFLFFIFFCLFVCFSCLNFFLFYIGFEFIFLLMFLFLLSWGYSPERAQASFYMVFYTLLVSFPFLSYVIFHGLGAFRLSFFYFSEVFFYWFFLFFVFLVKLPVYGVHLWLPKAHVEAPVSGSIVLAGVLLKLGGYGFYRFSFFVPFYINMYGSYLLSIGLVGGLISCFVCLRQVDLKAFAAYSSICHMGFFLGGAYSYIHFGFFGGVFILVSHGFCSSCLFYILYVIYKRFFSRSILILKGCIFVIPVFRIIGFLFFILNMGVPPRFSFISEVFIIISLGGASIFNVFLCFLFLFLAGVYCIYLYVLSHHGLNILDRLTISLFVREFVLFFAHFFPILFITFSLWFFFWLLSFIWIIDCGSLGLCDSCFCCFFLVFFLFILFFLPYFYIYFLVGVSCLIFFCLIFLGLSLGFVLFLIFYL